MSETTTPPIIMSSLDWDRLDQLMAEPANRRLPVAAALQRELDRARIVEPNEVPPEVVTMNSTIRFMDETSKAESELTLVYPVAAGAAGTVSVLAPVGSALLGLSVGQTIAWPMPGGRTAQLRVLEVLRQPEAMGEFHR